MSVGAHVSMRRHLGSLQIRQNLGLRRLTRRANVSGSTLNDCRGSGSRCGRVGRNDLLGLTSFCRISISCLLNLAGGQGCRGAPVRRLRLDSRIIRLLGDRHFGGQLLYRVVSRRGFERLLTSTRVCISKVTAVRFRSAGDSLTTLQTVVLRRRPRTATSQTVGMLRTYRMRRRSFFYRIARGA